MKLKNKVITLTLAGTVLLGGTVSATVGFPEQINMFAEQEKERVASTLEQKEITYRETKYNNLMNYTAEQKAYITKTINEYVDQQVAEKYSYHSKEKIDVAVEKAIQELKAYVDQQLAD